MPLEEITATPWERGRPARANHVPSNRRREKRVPINALVCRVARKSGLFGLLLRGKFRACDLRNISLGGFNFASAQDMEIGDEFRITFESVATGERHSLEGVIVHRRQVPAGVNLYGCERRSELDHSLVDCITKRALRQNLAQWRPEYPAAAQGA